MGTYKEIEGNLITLAQQGTFDVVAHGANCFCKMARGIAPQMADAFGVDKYPKEGMAYKGDINKLGTIDYGSFYVGVLSKVFIAVNCYTQYHWSTETKPFDYDAFTLCMRKMNHVFKGKHIGLPQIGSHLAGGDWERIKEIIKKELTEVDVTIVIFKP